MASKETVESLERSVVLGISPIDYEVRGCDEVCDDFCNDCPDGVYTAARKTESYNPGTV